MLIQCYQTHENIGDYWRKIDLGQESNTIKKDRDNT